MGVNGHPLLETPHLDGLARDGVNFTHAFTAIPVCTPARSCLLHGRWSTQHLAIANWDTEAPRPSVEGLPTFTGALAGAGYRLGYIGKWHVHRTRTPLEYGFHEYVSEEELQARRAADGFPPVPHPGGWFGNVDSAPPEASALHYGAEEAIRFLRRAERPFFLRWDPGEPHLPCVPPEPFNSLYPPETIPPWPGFPDPLEGKPAAQRQQRRTWGVDDWTWDDWAPVVGRCLGVIAQLDAEAGRVLGVLDELGLRDDTLVVYTTDHGDLCGSHGMMDKHFVMYDDVVRVPLVMRWPRRIPAGSSCDGFVCSSLDLATTFLEAAGVPVPPGFRGYGLIPLPESGNPGWRDDIFSMYHGNQFGLYTQRMVRDRRWKYIWNAAAEDELYDLERDPGEIRNLARDPSAAGELERLRIRLIEWMNDVEDPILNGWIRGQILEGRSL